jgi:hypothetical protein
MASPEQTISQPHVVDAFEIIRTETVLSRLPVHNLSKTGDFNVVITKRDEGGDVTLHWSISYSAKYGPPRQLAYKLDTLVVNRYIDEAGRPVPKVLRLGSLREIARKLNLGGDTNQIRRALRQNAFTGISAKLKYRSAAGEERRIEADFTRYGVVFHGEKLPDGRQADAVYLVLNEPYLEVLNQASMRPLNYDYMRQLSPAAQRFYEIVSYRIYAALKYGHPTAKLAYSEFCLCSALQRYTDYDHFKKQMYKIHRPHLDSAYLARVVYQETRDEQGCVDWIMLYVPGRKAMLDFNSFHQRPLAERPAQPFLAELTRRGITELQARKLLAQTRQGQPIKSQLEWGDELITRSRGRITNPPGFYAYLLKHDVRPPQGFEEHPPNRSTLENTESRKAYEQHCRQLAMEYLRQRYQPAEYERLLELKGREVRQQYPASELWSRQQLREVTEGLLIGEALKTAPVPTFERFQTSRRASSKAAGEVAR